MNYIDKFINQNGTSTPIINGADKFARFNGKRVCFIGDSITDSTYYPDAFCEATGAIEYNRGRSGSEIAGTNAYSFCSRIQWDRNDGNKYADGRKLCLVGLPRKPHLFIVYGGINDWGKGITFGDVDDDNYPTQEITFTANGTSYTLNVPTTFCGGVKFLFNYLKTNYPNVPIVALSLHHVNGTFTAWNTYSTFDPSTSTYTERVKSDKTWRDYKEAYETIVKSMNIPIVDLELLPFTPYTDDMIIHYKDGLHFSKTGAKIVGNYVAEKVSNLIFNMPTYDTD